MRAFPGKACIYTGFRVFQRWGLVVPPQGALGLRLDGNADVFSNLNALHAARSAHRRKAPHMRP